MAGWRGEAARARRMAEQDEAPRRVQHSIVGIPVKSWPSKTFTKLVENVEVEKGQTEEALRSFDDEQVNGHVDELEDMEMDSPERQQKLCTVYSLASDVYSSMNRAIREDDPEAIGKLAPYIRELKDVFLTDHENQVITPFEGTVWRGVSYDDPEKALEEYQRDHEFAWPAFSSTSLDSGVADGFGSGSGLVFEIRCYPPAGTFDDDDPEFAPASISAWSVFGDAEQEILFPPNVKFRVVNVKKPTEENGLNNPIIQCETVSFESVWSMVKNDDLDGVKRWVKANPDRVNTEDCRHHLLDEVDDDDDEESESESEDSDEAPQVRSKGITLGDGSVKAVLKASGAKRGPGGRKPKKACNMDCVVS